MIATVNRDRTQDAGAGVEEAFAAAERHLEPQELRRAFSHFPSSVAAVCAMVQSRPVGFAVSTFTPVSLDPPLASICVQRSSTTWPQLAQCERLGVSLLAHGQQDAGRTLALREGDRFEGVDYASSSQGALFLWGAAEWIDCSVHDLLEAGDHVIVLLRLHRVVFDTEADPLVFHSSRFRRLHDGGDGATDGTSPDTTPDESPSQQGTRT